LDTRFTPPARSAREGIGLALAAWLARRIGVVAVAVEPGATRALTALTGLLEEAQLIPPLARSTKKSPTELLASACGLL